MMQNCKAGCTIYGAFQYHDDILDFVHMFRICFELPVLYLYIKQDIVIFYLQTLKESHEIFANFIIWIQKDIYL